jgi:cell division protein FtsL
MPEFSKEEHTMTLGLAVIGGIVAIVAISEFAETVKNKKVRRAELEEIRQDISQIKTDISDMKEQLADIVIKLLS